MIYLDGCPACVMNAELPTAIARADDGSAVCDYRCSDCGHEWFTTWAAESTGSLSSLSVDAHPWENGTQEAPAPAVTDPGRGNRFRGAIT